MRAASPKTSNGAVIFQVAAVTRQGDALAMADALQRKKFPSFVVAPSTDNFYRVQVGPYPDQRSAEASQERFGSRWFQNYNQTLNEFAPVCEVATCDSERRASCVFLSQLQSPIICVGRGRNAGPRMLWRTRLR